MSRAFVPGRSVSEEPVTDRAAPSLALTHVTVIDGTGGPVVPDATVVIREGRIRAVGPGSAVSVPAGTPEFEAQGKFVIPGLWDMHGHVTYTGPGALTQMVAHGVTGVRDLGGRLEQIDAWRAEIERGDRVGPHIVRAGPFVDGPKEGIPDRLTVRTEAEARRAVRSLRAAGVDFIKVHNALPPAAFFALMEEARAAGIPVAVHLPQGVSSVEASDAGVASLEHVETFAESALWRKGATCRSVPEAVEENLGPIGREQLRRIAKNGTWYVPSLVAYERGFVLWSNDPEALGPRLSIHQKQLDVVRAMREAGVRLLAGSDFSDWGAVPGIDLHNELALFVEAGLSPVEALQTATLNPAQFFGWTDRYGTVQPGRVADLVVLDMNPLDNISHTRKIHAVVLAGRLLRVPARLT